MKQAMIFAAGLGTRLKPLTDTMPKALVTVGGRPLIEHVVQKLKAAGFERIVVNVHHFASQITDFLQANNHFGLDIRISDETGALLETGGGIRQARPLFDPNSPVLIHNVDILSNLDLARLYDSATQKPQAEAMLVVSQRQTQRYLLFDESHCLAGWTNKATGEVRSPHDWVLSQPDNPRLTPLAFSGIHVFGPSLFPLMESWPARFPIIDFYLSVCRDHHLCAYEAPNLRLVDVGKLDTLDQAEQFLNTL